MGPSRYDHLILYLSENSPYGAFGMRRGCDGLKRPSGERYARKPRDFTSIEGLGTLELALNAVPSRLPFATPPEGAARGIAPQESFRVISTARLRTLPPVHLPPIDVVVCNDPNGDLILRLASCLDAFSTYPYPTRLPGRAPGGTTGWPEVGPTRSSRTSVRSPQISNAHNR